MQGAVGTMASCCHQVRAAPSMSGRPALSATENSNNNNIFSFATYTCKLYIIYFLSCEFSENFFYDKPHSGESTTSARRVSYQLLAVMLLK